MPIKTGNKIRYKGVYRLYRNDVPVSETPYNLLDAFGSTPALTIEELELMTTQDIEARASAMIEAIGGKCSDFKIINNIIEISAECVEEEDDFMIGQIIDFAGQQWDETKWMECAGQELAVVDYPELYEVIGREWTYSTIADNKFNVPDLRKRVMAGFDAASPATPRDSVSDSVFKAYSNFGRVGNYGGEEFHRLSALELPGHTHFMFANTSSTGAGSDFPTSASQVTKGREVADTLSFRTGKTDADAELGRTGETGSDFTHENRPPYVVTRKLIRFK
jgi:microcystin-dependent protein